MVNTARERKRAQVARGERGSMVQHEDGKAGGAKPYRPCVFIPRAMRSNGGVLFWGRG